MSAPAAGHAHGHATLVLPRAAVLGDGRWCTLVTGAGSGGTWFEDYALTRWRPERLGNRYGWWFQVRDAESGRCQPIGRSCAGTHESRASASAPGRFALVCEDDGLVARLDMCVAGEGPIELRRVTLRNASGRARTIEVATALEVSLQHPAIDAAHPAFSKLFVQTEFVAEHRVLLARRRARGDAERPPWMALMTSGTDALEWETDRARLLGRGNAAQARARMVAPCGFTGTTGNVLDPVLAFRRSVSLAPGAVAALDFALAAAGDRAAVLAHAGAGLDPDGVTRMFEQAEACERERLARLALDPGRATLLQSLAAAALEGHAALRARPDVLGRAAGSLDVLVNCGIDPSRPLVALRWPSPAGTATGALEAVQYWRALGLPFQLLVIADDLTETGLPTTDPGAGVRVVPFEALGAAGVDLALATACWVPEVPLDARIAELAPELPPAITQSVSPVPVTPPSREPSRPADPDPEALHFANGIGGFSLDGSEYVIHVTGEGHTGRPPLPWINVIANERMGFLVSEAGAASTWGCNSHEYRLTPWSNDPLLDPHAEALYVRDEDSGAFWSPLPGPAGGSGAYEVRHGLGVSRFLHTRDGLEHDTQLFVAREDPVRFCRVRLVNRSARTRRVSLHAYQQLVLGTLPETSARFVVTTRDPACGALFASSAVGDAFAGRVAFAGLIGQDSDTACDCTTDRRAFLGPNGDVCRPEAVVLGGPLGLETGPGLDPCFAMRAEVELSPGEEVERTFVLGDAVHMREARALLARYSTADSVDMAYVQATAFWRDFVSGLRIETPEPAIDLMVNNWLPYQVLSGRILGRTAFYQSSGAYGFRDQLQDASALTMLDPQRFRGQILLHASHQFVEGDVLHWWHPPLDRGVRTRFADDLLWLPYLAAGYVHATGDASILDERCPFLAAPVLAPGADEALVEPHDAAVSANVYEHACLAMDRSLATGEHGLPLFGSGDWNDGMNRVGNEGRGESVWMGFFLISVIAAFTPLCERRGDAARAERYRAHAAALHDAIERHGWDGGWYLRAYDDDGRPLGTHADDECRIDGLVQAWAVISRTAPPGRAREAMNAMEAHLVSESEGIMRLLTPPFEHTSRDPGYIKGYVKGVRENGGQYTHAALWMVQALAESGRRDRAARLLAMLSPVSHARDAAGVARYQVEPYVVAADVYGASPHVGRGGWTWYTGSASWMYRVAIESVLGIEWLNGDTIRVKSRMPDQWPACTVEWRIPGTHTCYRIEMKRTAPGGIRAATVDGRSAVTRRGEADIPIERDGRRHHVTIEFGEDVSEDPGRTRAGKGAIEDPATARGGPGGPVA